MSSNEDVLSLIGVERKSNEVVVGASKFKEQCLAILEHLPEEGVVITKHGRKLARVVPYSDAEGALIGALAGKLEVNGDLLSTGSHWQALD